jgi:hypothetical protein
MHHAHARGSSVIEDLDLTRRERAALDYAIERGEIDPGSVGSVTDFARTLREETREAIDTVPTDEELERRRREERIVALVRRDKMSGDPPTAVLLDIDEARRFGAFLEMWNSNEHLLARILQTPESLASLYEDWEELEQSVTWEDEAAGPFFQRARWHMLDQAATATG